MTEYDKTNRGIMSRNEKRRNDKDAEFSGSINVEGKEYWLNGWVNARKSDGGKFFSLSVKPKEKINVAPKDEFQDRPLAEVLSDDVPF